MVTNTNSGKLPNNDTQITTAPSTDEDSSNTKDGLPPNSPHSENNNNNLNEKENIDNTNQQQNKPQSTIKQEENNLNNIDETKIDPPTMIKDGDKSASAEIPQEDTKQAPNSDNKTSTNNNTRSKSDVGSRTMEQWLARDNLIVHPVWIGNLPRGTTVNQLRHFVESQVGRVLVSIHISIKQQNNERTYAFLNLPTAEVLHILSIYLIYFAIIYILK